MLEMNQPPANIDHSLGLMRGHMEALTRDFQEEKINRKEIAKSLDDIAKAQAVILHKMENYEGRMDSVEIPVGEFKAWRERIRGALWLATAAGGAIGAGLTYIWAKLSN